MPLSDHKITPVDILPMDVYEAQRRDRRQTLLAVKKNRRVDVGPFVTFYFESYDTMWHQVHEMLYIERGGDDQIKDELAAYNPLIPQGRELVATVMLEIDEPDRRAEILRTLTGIEKHLFIEVAGEKTYAVPEHDVDRTAEDGKTSAVHFLHFPLGEELVSKFHKAESTIFVGCDHANYTHMAGLSSDTKTELSKDFS